MPCPYFEPLLALDKPTHPSARLPLFDEYDGLCHAGAAPSPPPTEARFRCCNHGYSRGACDRFPHAEMRSALRYNVVGHTHATLSVLCVEETDHAPSRVFNLTYDLVACVLHSDGTDERMRAQATAFCFSYLKRFPLPDAR